jgi:hypothetical protein
MYKNYVKLFSCLVITLIFAAAINAQDRTLASAVSDRYVISARAGGVNFVRGDVFVARSGDKVRLDEGDQVDAGEIVSTGPSGRAEILLNPGSFLRLDSNSSVELKTTSLDDLEIKIHSGNVMFEVFASSRFRVELIAPKGRIFLVESGVYRVSVDTQGTPSVQVWQGLARLGDRALTRVQKSHAGSITSGVASVAKFDRGDNKNEFVEWSEIRGKELAKTTKRIKDKAMRDSLLSSFNGGRWGFHNSFGLWVRDSRFGRYCFLPFGYDWYSPYGFWYGNSIYWYNLPQIIYQVQPQSSNPYGVKTRRNQPGVGGELAGADTVQGGSGRIDRQPPFRQLENGAKVNGPVRQAPDYPTDRPIYIPPPPPPIPVYIPAPNTGARPPRP